MKKTFLMLVMLISACCSLPARAQEVNVSMQPVWGPVGYNYVNYYYIPAIEAYYSVPYQTYTWFDGGRWVTTPYLPPRYAGFDLYHAYKVVLNEANPWYRHDYYRGYYYGYRARYDQPMIRESHDERYFANPNHPEHAHWAESHRDVRRAEERHSEFERRGEVHREEEHRGEVRREEEHRGEVHREEERRGEARREETHNAPAQRGEFHSEPARTAAPANRSNVTAREPVKNAGGGKAPAANTPVRNTGGATKAIGKK